MAQFGAISTPRNTSLLFLQDGEHHRSARLFNGVQDPLETIKGRRCDAGLWDHTNEIEEGVIKWIVSAGFDGVLRTGYQKIDHALITALVESRRPETHTFHFPVGEATVTLQDVQVLWALPINGPVVSGEWECKSKDEWLSDCDGYLGFVPGPDEVDAGRVKIRTLIEEIQKRCRKSKKSYKQRARVYILAFLGGHLFSDSRSYDVSLNFLKNLNKLSEACRKSWGSAVLSFLYRKLCNAAEKKDVKGIQGPLILLQLWAGERIPQIAPLILLGDSPIQYPHCYGSRWNRHFSHTATPAHVLVTYRATFTALQEGQFIWCPYSAVLGQLPGDCTNDSELWAYIGWLVFWNVAEPHVPNRVCRQFAYVQGVPDDLYIFTVRQHKKFHEAKLTGGRGTDWLENKEVEVGCWNSRHSNVYQFSGPAGGGVLPGYIQWFYERTVLLITSPDAQNAPNVYPEWGGVQQT